mmetsp:Transcript_22777/g.44341  ORF Transcript_22777/g.44341 Transcript_22777/m.44341 type:complete len:306 (+) Transcript_22777:416-1333(+)
MFVDEMSALDLAKGIVTTKNIVNEVLSCDSLQFVRFAVSWRHVPLTWTVLIFFTLAHLYPSLTATATILMLGALVVVTYAVHGFRRVELQKEHDKGDHHLHHHLHHHDDDDRKRDGNDDEKKKKGTRAKDTKRNKPSSSGGKRRLLSSSLSSLSALSLLSSSSKPKLVSAQEQAKIRDKKVASYWEKLIRHLDREAEKIRKNDDEDASPLAQRKHHHAAEGWIDDRNTLQDVVQMVSLVRDGVVNGANHANTFVQLVPPAIVFILLGYAVFVSTFNFVVMVIIIVGIITITIITIIIIIIIMVKS